MTRQQGDLFSGSFSAERHVAPCEATSAVAWDALGEEELLAALPDAGMAAAVAIAAEIGRRKPPDATAALERLCRRFIGFGLEQVVPEQAAALDALVMIGDRRAAEAVSRVIMSRVVQGPGLGKALAAAAKLGSKLPPEVALPLLRHHDPGVRADACQCVGDKPPPEIVSTLFDLLDDLHDAVGEAAACALGRARQRGAREFLLARLRGRPSPRVIEAVAAIADEECVVLLGRIGRDYVHLRAVVLGALDEIDHPQAEKVAARLRRESRGDS
jgi:HEAT repeat protein